MITLETPFKILVECENIYNIEKFTRGHVTAVFPGVFRFLDQMVVER